LTFVVLVIQFSVKTFIEQGQPWHNAYLQDLVDYITISITLLVVAVPEGLPLAVILALAYSIKVSSSSSSTTTTKTNVQETQIYTVSGKKRPRYFQLQLSHFLYHWNRNEHSTIAYNLLT